MAGASNGFSKSCARACRSLYASYSRSLPVRKARSERPGLPSLGSSSTEARSAAELRRTEGGVRLASSASSGRSWLARIA